MSVPLLLTVSGGAKDNAIPRDAAALLAVKDPRAAEAAARASLNQGSLEPRVRFRTDFEMRPDGLVLMIWQVQPDGMYWRDEDGFGITPDEEIRLYALIDGEGRFTGPFRLYNIGVTDYYERPGR